MAVDEITKLIGDAWALHRNGDNAGAVRAFEAILQRDADNVDAAYGLGLAQRALGNKDAARKSFERSKSLAEKSLATIRRERDSNDLKTDKDDRDVMLLNMLKQRLAEV